MEEPDPQVIVAAQRGKTEAFERLVRSYQAPVWHLVFHLVGDEDVAADVTQDAFLRAYRFLPRYRGDSKFSTWLLSVARNCAMDELRKSRRRRRLVERLQRRPAPPDRDEIYALEVYEALAELPIELREPVVLIDMIGRSYAEVASILGVPLGTVKSRVHRGRLLVATALRPPGEKAIEE